MPLYTARCTGCGLKDTFFSKVDDRDQLRYHTCGQLFERTIEAPTLQVFQPYQSPIDNKWIDSPSARRDDLRRNGCIEWEPGLKQDMPSIRQSNLDRDWAPVEAAVDSTVRDMVASGKISPL